MPHQDYTHGGVAFPSVTEVLGWKPKPWLEKWRDKWGYLAERKTEAAGNIGDAFHSAAERLSKGEEVDYPKTRRLGKMLERIETWLSEEGFIPKYTELHVVSVKYRYHGSLDAIGTVVRYGTALVIIDYKSSSGIYDDMAEQLAAYAQAVYEQLGVRIKLGIIVHVSKKKPHHRITIKEYKLTKTLLNKFLRKLRSYWRDHGELE